MATALGQREVISQPRASLRDLGELALPAGLTSREAEVLRLVAGGATNKEVATALYLSVKDGGAAPAQRVREARGPKPHRSSRLRPRQRPGLGEGRRGSRTLVLTDAAPLRCR